MLKRRGNARIQFSQLALGPLLLIVLNTSLLSTRRKSPQIPDTMRFQISAAMVLLTVSSVFAIPVVVPEEKPVKSSGGRVIGYRDLQVVDEGNTESVIFPELKHRDVDDSAVNTESIFPERKVRRDGPISEVSGNGGHAFPGEIL